MADCDTGGVEKGPRTQESEESVLVRRVNVDVHVQFSRARYT